MSPELPRTASVTANKESASPPLPFSSPQFVEAWEEWLEYRREQKLRKWKPITVRKQFKQFAEWGESETIATINYSIANAYQGIFPPKNENRTPSRRVNRNAGTLNNPNEFNDLV